MARDDGAQRRSRAWNRALWAIVGVGVVLRVVRYAADRSLWIDEGAIALNIIGKTYRELLGELDFLQGAPVGFLVIEKAATDLLGERDLALRLFPLLCGIASMVLMLALARRVLSPAGAVIALSLFALSEPLVYFSTEAKLYQTDLAVVLALVLAAIAIEWGAVRGLKFASLAVAGAAMVWLSYAAVLALPALVAALLVVLWIRRDHRALRVVGALAAVWGFAAIGAYAVARNNIDRVASAAIGEVELASPGRLSVVRDFWDFFSEDLGVANTATALATVAAVAGFILLIRRNFGHALLVVTPVVATLAAAQVDLYPSTRRFLIFLVPYVALLVGEGAGTAVSLVRSPLKIAAAAGACLLLIYPAGIAADNLVDPPGHEEVKSVLRHMDRDWKPGDALYVWLWAQYPFRYYAECSDCGVLGASGPATVVWPPDPSGLPNNDALATHEPTLYWSGRPSGLDALAEGLARLDGKKRAWFLFSSNWDDEFVRRTLDCLGRQLTEYRATRAVAYLYDLDAPPSGRACPG